MTRYSVSELGENLTPLLKGRALGLWPILSFNILKWCAQLGRYSTMSGGHLGFVWVVEGGAVGVACWVVMDWLFDVRDTPPGLAFSASANVVVPVEVVGDVYEDDMVVMEMEEGVMGMLGMMGESDEMIE